MRRLALATVLGMIGLAGAAAAWTDPGGRMNLDAPRGWTVQPRQSDGATVVLAFTPSSDCYFYSVPNPTTASSTVRAARNTIAPLSAEAWVQTTQGVPDLFRAGTPTVVSQSVDTSGFWPVQRAQLQSGSNTVHAALQVRPGFELRGFCSGGEASYDAILNALSHPNDQAWQAQAEQEAATAAAAPAPAAEEPAPEQPQQRPRRGRGITSGPSSEQTGTGM